MSIRLFVQGPSGLKKYPAGTKFRILAKVATHQGGTKYLKSHHSWRYDVIGHSHQQLHIVQGDADADKKELEKAARTKRNVAKWVVPSSARTEDDVVIYIGGYGFFATAQIDLPAKRRKDWKNRYGSPLRRVRLIDPPISLFAIRLHIPKLIWAKYPRSIHTPSASIASHIRTLIQKRNELGIPDLDNKALQGGNLYELRKVAVLSARTSVKGITATTLTRARSRAIQLYVLKRAGGFCEGCSSAAPFYRPDGSAYLEPHHTSRLADDGPDHPNAVIALCPNCHRRAHSAADSESFNGALRLKLKRLES